MNRYRGWKILKIVLMIALAITLFGFITMQLWNWLMPAIFGLKPVTFAQALGLLVLGKILFGGFHRQGGRKGGWRRDWGRQWEERWARMTPEERERFRAGMRGKRCGWWAPPEQPSEPAAQ